MKTRSHVVLLKLFSWERQDLKWTWKSSFGVNRFTVNASFSEYNLKPGIEDFYVMGSPDTNVIPRSSLAQESQWYTFLTFYFILEYGQLKLLCSFQVNSKELSHTHIYPFSQTPIYPGCHIAVEQSSLCHTVGSC